MTQPSVAIMDEPRTFILYGYWKAHDRDKTRGAEMMELLGQVWTEVREKKLANGGISYAVYDCGDIVFSGVELKSADDSPTSLVKKHVAFTRYAYSKHIGPVSELGTAYTRMEAHITKLGLTGTCPSMEIYGHWTSDESKSETEIFISVE